MTIEEKLKGLPTELFARFIENIHDDKVRTSCYFARLMGMPWCEKHEDCKSCLCDFLAQDESKLLQVIQ